jgi:putative transcriptional regulator
MRTRLYSLRKQKCISADEIAKAVGIKKRTYYSIEAGQKNPSWPVAKRLGDLFDQDPRVLLAESKDSDIVNR